MIVVFIALFLTAPFFVAHAETANGNGVSAPPLFPQNCPGGALKNPNGNQDFPDAATSRDKIQDYIGRRVNCASACWDETITVTIYEKDGIHGTSIKTEGVNTCLDKKKLPKDQSPPRGCEKGQVSPTLTIFAPGVTILNFFDVKPSGKPKSRCVAADIVDSMMHSVFEGDNTMAGTHVERYNFLATQPPTPVQLKQDTPQFQQVLAAFGVTDETVAQDPRARDLVACVKGFGTDATCNPERLETVAKDLGITNTAFRQTIATLATKQQALYKQNEQCSLTNSDNGRTLCGALGRYISLYTQYVANSTFKVPDPPPDMASNPSDEPMSTIGAILSTAGEYYGIAEKYVEKVYQEYSPSVIKGAEQAGANAVEISKSVGGYLLELAKKASLIVPTPAPSKGK
jgi:hypothetical protein